MGLACALSGHRELPYGFDYEKLFLRLSGLVDRGFDRFYVGMAKGFDLAALNALIKIKDSLKRVHITACIPFEGQSNAFLEKEREDYFKCLKRCDDKIVFYPKYSPGCMHLRNRYMVDNSDMLFAYLNKDSGGTFYTVGYAAKKNKPIELF